MSVLLLRLSGPMQSWGTQSRFSHRDTGLEPSKSGVVGLLCAALGRPRHQPVADLAALEMAVRVDHEGQIACDFHTAGGSRQGGQPYGVVKADGKAGDTVVSRRYFLADADFLVGLAGDPALLQELHQALRSPVWPLYLGRKSFVPGMPVWLPDGLRPDETLVPALVSHPWQPPRRHKPERLRLVLETDPESGEVRHDVPLSFADRCFTVRHVRMDFIEPPVSQEACPCT
ncbi:MAG: type I-E CRISPR-associated protein Cas5/CasD [Phycisphaerae bacterium]|nr:type I-E CRISPR-associated protein Cas5/CasD [Phycisphaerae bacterium]